MGASQLIPITLVPLTLADAITKSGGIEAPDAQFTTIRIYRDGTLYEVPMEDYLSQGDLRDIVMQDGDSVFVDTTFDLDRAQRYYEQQIEQVGLRHGARVAALAELQAEIELRRAALDERRRLFQARLELEDVERDYVFLAGEVTNQARVPLPFGRVTHLADVLYGSGGFLEVNGDPSQIYVLRAGGDTGAPGTVTAWQLDARNAAAITLATRFEMRPDDVVFVAAQPITTWNRALRQSFPVLVNASVSAAE